MRRKDREITDPNQILAIMKKCDSCSVAFLNEPYPYVIPLNFGVRLQNDRFELFFHSATVGTKLDLIRKNNHVAFEMSCSHRLLLGKTACASTMEYESVCGVGLVEELEGQAKLDALSVLMDQYQHDRAPEFEESAVRATVLLQLNVTEISGKRLG